MLRTFEYTRPCITAGERTMWRTANAGMNIKPQIQGPIAILHKEVHGGVARGIVCVSSGRGILSKVVRKFPVFAVAYDRNHLDLLMVLSAVEPVWEGEAIGQVGICFAFSEDRHKLSTTFCWAILFSMLHSFPS